MPRNKTRGTSKGIRESGSFGAEPLHSVGIADASLIPTFKKDPARGARPSIG